MRGDENSVATAELAASLGLKVVDFAGVSKGGRPLRRRHEVDPQSRMLKGGGGAIGCRERIVAAAAVASGGVRVNMIDEAKLVPRLGSRMPLPVEVVPMVLASVRRQLEDMGLDGSCGKQKTVRGMDRTDNGNLSGPEADGGTDRRRRGGRAARDLRDGGRPSTTGYS